MAISLKLTDTLFAALLTSLMSFGFCINDLLYFWLSKHYYLPSDHKLYNIPND